MRDAKRKTIIYNRLISLIICVVLRFVCLVSLFSSNLSFLCNTSFDTSTLLSEFSSENGLDFLTPFVCKVDTCCSCFSHLISSFISCFSLLISSFISCFIFICCFSISSIICLIFSRLLFITSSLNQFFKSIGGLKSLIGFYLIKEEEEKKQLQIIHN